MGEGAGAEDQDDVLGFRLKVGWPRRVGSGGVDHRPDGALAGSGIGRRAAAFFGQQGRQGNPAEARAAMLKKLPAVEQVASGVGELIPHVVVPFLAPG